MTDNTSARPQDTIALHDDPVKHWLLQRLLASADTEVSVDDQALQGQLNEQFKGVASTLSVIADELYRQGIIELRSLEWMSLSAQTRQIIRHCIEEQRAPSWEPMYF